jgi:UDP-glucose 4-epimerase
MSGGGQPVLLVGARGLLGAAMSRALARRGTPMSTVAVPWSDPDAAAGSLLAAASIARDTWGDSWSLAWCAGAGVTGSTEEDLETEVNTLRRLVDGMVAPGGPAPSALFLASSAGGVYAGSSDPPFTELTEPSPVAPYGRAKLQSEAVVSRLTDVGTRVLVGRISNLYGPGQNLSKQQGLVSRLCRSHLLREPVSVYVSLDTIRDYLFVDDCAEMVCDALDRLAELENRIMLVKIFAAQQTTSIASLLGDCRRVFGSRVLVTIAASPLANQQARNLGFRSVVWPEIDQRSLTTIPHGVHATVEDLRRHLMAATSA